MSDFLFPHGGIILDACCVINLYASGYMKSVLESIPKQVAVTSYVCNVEAHRIYSGPVEDITKKTELINLQSFIDEQLLQVVFPESEAEENTIVNFSSVATLDSGEAITAAIAVHRQLSLGTDDKAAISFFKRNIPQLHVISTLDILKHWADTTDPQLGVISIMLENIQNRARYKPHYNHHLYAWWKHHRMLNKNRDFLR